MFPDTHRFIIDAARFPFVYVTYPEVAGIDNIDQAMLDLYDVAELGKFVALIDVRPLRIHTATPLIRKHYFEKKRAFDDSEIGKRMLCEAVIVRTGVHHTLLRVYLWMHVDNDCPIRAFSSFRDAEAWAQTIADAARLPGAAATHQSDG